MRTSLLTIAVSCLAATLLVAGGAHAHDFASFFQKNCVKSPERPPPLANLLVSYLQYLQLEVGEFGSGAGTLAGLS
jgi:hypothetical protein